LAIRQLHFVKYVENIHRCTHGLHGAVAAPRVRDAHAGGVPVLIRIPISLEPLDRSAGPLWPGAAGSKLREVEGSFPAAPRSTDESQPVYFEQCPFLFFLTLLLDSKKKASTVNRGKALTTINVRKVQQQ